MFNVGQPENVQVHLKQGHVVLIFRERMDLYYTMHHDAWYNAMHQRGTAYITGVINKECTVPMLRTAIEETAHSTGVTVAYDIYFYYSELPTPTVHHMYGTVAGWGYWEYKLRSII